ncbi:hypothetical protein DH09_11425 [Bacillaceae bacterium JMAK1]|nr:hypothetical protein DH09_11425 [Bacillaceae bacterium JMAK1]
MSLRERKKEKKINEILNSAMGLISKKGYHATTMDDIASELLMTKGSLYYYFKDKEDLVFYCTKQLLGESIQQAEEIEQLDVNSHEKLYKAIVVHMEYLLTERSGFEIGSKPRSFFSGEKLDDVVKLRHDYASCMDRMIEEGMASGEFEQGDVKVKRNLLLGAMNYSISWYSLSGPLDITETAHKSAEHLMKMFVK